MQHFVRIKKAVPKTHYFVYKDKEYPFNFYLFICSSKYFFKNQEEIKSSEKIHLVDEDSDFVLNFSDKTVEDFIRYAQREEICLNHENVSFLNYLAKKYEVQDLIEDTEEYISIHHSELILQILSAYQNDPTFESSTYEDFLADHFVEYLNDDLLLTLKIPIINRALKKFLDQKSVKKSINTQLFDFLFKYLDKHGREASVLFSYVDFNDDVNPEYLSLLLNKYYDNFDFYFINSTLLKRLIKTLTDANEKEKNIVKLKDEINQIKEENLFKLDEQMQEYDDQINSLKNEIQQISNFHLQQMNNQKQEYEKRIDDLKHEIDQIKEKDQKNQLKIKDQVEIFYLEYGEFKRVIKEIIIDDVDKAFSNNPEEGQIIFNEEINTVFDLKKLVAQKNHDDIDLVSLFKPFTTEIGTHFTLLNDKERILEILSENPTIHFGYKIINR